METLIAHRTTSPTPTPTIMIHLSFPTTMAAALASAVLAIQASAITAGDLAARLAAGEVIHLIDLRPSARFEGGTIPGAMSMPAAIILEKRLPPLSPAVVFDDGLGRVDVAGIVAALNQRSGWKAEALEGGFAAWQALAETAVTSPAGLREEDVQHITYDKLAGLTEPFVMVDVRPEDPATRGKPGARAALGRKPARATEADPVAGFCARAANRVYRHSLEDLRANHAPPAQARAQKRGSNPPRPAAAATPPLVVLVGAVDADQRETARRLRAEGYGRVLILAGGDESILLEGRRGKGRISGPVIEGKMPESEQPQPAQP
jgi:rhodanese-related sulfurtransferase